MAEPRELYRAVTPGFCEHLPFGVFEEQFSGFRSSADVPSTPRETIGIVDTMFGGCDLWSAVHVSIHTHATIEEARWAYGAMPSYSDSTPVRVAGLDGAVDRWRAFQYPLALAQNGETTRIVEMLDRNVVATAIFDFIPDRLDERRFEAATVEFFGAMWRYLRGRTGLTPASPIAAPARRTYQRLKHGFSPRWDISALEAVLGPRRRDRFPDFRSEDSSMVGCELHTDSAPGGTKILLYIKYFDSADKASAFFATHFTLATAPMPPFGALTDVTAISWQHQDDPGRYFIAVADSNVVVLLQVAPPPGGSSIDDRLAGPVAETLDNALGLIRAAE